MLTRSTALNTHLEIPIREDAVSRKLALIKLVALMSLVLTAIILSVMTTARIQPLPKLLDPPIAYLPGSLFPDDITCMIPDSRMHQHCFTNFWEDEIYFHLEGDTKTITRTSIRVPYTIGELVSSWGTPTGITWEGMMLYVYWGNRRVLLIDEPLRPETKIDFIIYDPVQLPESPWRGFQRRNTYPRGR